MTKTARLDPIIARLAQTASQVELKVTQGNIPGRYTKHMGT